MKSVINNESAKKSVRKSNFELLRILAMMMIVVHHITCHAFKVQLEDQSLYALGEGFNQLTFFKKLLLPQIFMAAGKIGNILFILITGYFLINKQINISKQIKKIFSQFIFVIPILAVTSFLYYKLFSNNFIGIQSFNIFNTGYWFIGYYIGIISIAYVFLNKILNNLNKNQYITVLTIMFAICSIAFLRNSISDISEKILTLFIGVGIYSLGGFIRLYNPLKNVRATILFSIIILATIMIFVNNYSETLININVAKENNLQGIYQKLESFGEYNISCLLIGISLFEVFKRIKIKNNALINYISSSTFMIYLVHDNTFLRNLWKEINWVEIYYNNTYKGILLYLIWLVGIFIVGITIYTLYYLFTKLVNTRFFKKIIFKT